MKLTYSFVLPLLPVFLLCGFSVNQAEENIYFKEGSVEGVIFNRDGEIVFGPIAKNRISVSREEIFEIDSMVYSFVEEQSHSDVLVQQGFDGCPIISESYDDYVRQVVGYEDTVSNQEIIYIQYIHSDVLERHSDWKIKWVYVSGGCSSYWQISLNKTTGELFGWVIN